MRALDTAHFEDAEKYAAYLKTPLGRLRSELAWENLRQFLPADVTARRALDLGGGTGSVSLRLAKMGFSVVLLDCSEDMIGIARKEAEACGIGIRMDFLREEASRLRELFPPESFDLVICHNFLEYVADPDAAIARIARVLRTGAVVSVLVRNRAGEALKAAIKSQDWTAARAALSAETVVDSLYGKPLRVFGPEVIADWLRRAGLEVVAERGVRVFSDYQNPSDLAGETPYRQTFELELFLGAHAQFAKIARYTQFVARRPSGSEKKGT